MIHAAAACGIDAVKVSLFTPEMMCPDSDAPEFQITEGLWKGQTLYELYRKAALPVEWIPKLKDLAESLGLGFVCGVYHPEGVTLGEAFGIERYKIASFEAGWKELLEAVDRTGRPVIMSTGIATLEELEVGVRLFRGRLTLLRCVSQYPAPIENFHLLTIPDLIRRFPTCKIGLSDHSLSRTVLVAAVALGAVVIERHIRIDEEGLDYAFSATPAELVEMIKAVRQAEASLGHISYEPTSTKYKRRFMEGLGWVRTVN
jgi:sialic acid synthase SpsE